MAEPMLVTMAEHRLSLDLSDTDRYKQIGQQLGLVNYRSRPLPPELPALPDESYNSNSAFWGDLASGRLRATMVVTLQDMHLFEWLPLSPGTFHTAAAAESRAAAQRYLLRLSGFALDGGDVFGPDGKRSMIRGGIGCLRLSEHLFEHEACCLMAASSSPVAHEGIPVALPRALYAKAIRWIAQYGAVLCTLRGRLCFLPRSLEQVFLSQINLPRLYLLVEEFIAPECPPEPERLEVSVAVAYTAGYRSDVDAYLTYATFNPAGGEHAIQRCSNWIGETYINGLYNGRVLTDFDEQVRRFDQVVFGLQHIMSGRASFGPLASDHVERARADTIVSYQLAELRTPPRTDDDMWELSLSPQTAGSYTARVRYHPAGNLSLVEQLRGSLPVVSIQHATLLENANNPVAYGKALGGMLFADSHLREAFSTAWGAARRHRRALRVQLNLEEAPELHLLRWETLYDYGSRPICPDSTLRFSRYVGTNDQREVSQPVGATPSLLAMVADPVDLKRYNLPRLTPPLQRIELEQVLGGPVDRALPFGGRRANLAGLAQELERGVDILYLAAHGVLRDGEAYLYLESEDHTVEIVAGSELAQVIRDVPRPPALVVLASCDSAGNDGEDAARALGPQLVRAGALAVLGMHGSISFGLAEVALPLFLDAVLKSGRPDEALALVRRALRARRLDWWRPVLFSRSDNGQLWPPRS